MRHSFARKPISILLSVLMLLSVFGGMTFSASAAAVTPKYKITVSTSTGSSTKTETMSSGAALPYSTTPTAIMKKFHTNLSSVYNVVHKSGSKICTLSKTTVKVNTFGSEAIKIYINSSQSYSVTINVTPVTKCVVTATGYTGTYDTEAHTIEGFTVTSPESGATVKYGTASGTYNLTAPPSFTDVGTHTVYYQVAAKGWVTLTGSLNVVINPKTVTVTADAKSKIRGESDPALTYTAEGLFGEDTVTGELTREAGEAIGTYAIQQGTLAVGSNYTLAYTGANLTIEPNADDLAAANVDALINAIGEVAYTDDCKTKIDEARAAYDALTDTQKALVTNASVLTDAESAYAAAAEQAAADAVIAKINAIGEVAYTDECKTKIDEAKAAYEALNDTQKALVTNTATLTAAENTYASLKAAAEVLAAEKSAAKTEIANYVHRVDYRAAQQEQLEDAIVAAVIAIEDAADTTAVAAAVESAKAVIDAIKTDAQLTAEELAAAKTAAKEAIEAYKSAEDYRDAQKTELESAIAAAKAAIDAAADLAAVNAAVATAKTSLDAIPTDAQLTAVEAVASLAAAKTAAKETIEAYKSAEDYRDAQKTELESAIAAAKAAIDAAADLAAVNAAVATAKTSLDAIPTDAQLTAQENLAAAKQELQEAIASARAFYETLKSQSKYAKIANTLNAAIERAESALKSDDAAEVLENTESVSLALTTAQADKDAFDADPANSTGNPSLYRIIKAIVEVIVFLFTKVLPKVHELTK